MSEQHPNAKERTGPGTREGEQIIIEYTDPIQDEVFRIVEEINPNPELGVTHDIVTYVRPRVDGEWVDRGVGHATDINYSIMENDDE